MLFALVDCNNFYASCERLFAPSLHGKPVVVLSNNDGCVIARSPEAKALGVKMGEPWFKVTARSACRYVQVRSANFTLYGDMSHRVMEAITANTPDMEIYSIDECFIDYTGMAADAAEHAKALRATVRQWTGLPVSIGLGATKTLAKIANHRAKADPDGVFSMLDQDVCENVLKETLVGDIWGDFKKRDATDNISTRHAATSCYVNSRYVAAFNGSNFASTQQQPFFCRAIAGKTSRPVELLDQSASHVPVKRKHSAGHIEIHLQRRKFGNVVDPDPEQDSISRESAVGEELQFQYSFRHCGRCIPN